MNWQLVVLLRKTFETRHQFDIFFLHVIIYQFKKFRGDYFTKFRIFRLFFLKWIIDSDIWIILIKGRSNKRLCESQTWSNYIWNRHTVTLFVIIDRSEHTSTNIVIVVYIIEADCVGHQILIEDNLVRCKEHLHIFGDIIFRLTSSFDHTDLQK